MFPPQKNALVMDKLNAHTPVSRYDAFIPEEAIPLREKLEIHYTPRHGSWLNMAEIELNVLITRGLSKRISTIERLEKEAKAWSLDRNRNASFLYVYPAVRQFLEVFLRHEKNVLFQLLVLQWTRDFLRGALWKSGLWLPKGSLCNIL
jgi:hypothetical protein